LLFGIVEGKQRSGLAGGKHTYGCILNENSIIYGRKSTFIG